MVSSLLSSAPPVSSSFFPSVPLSSVASSFPPSSLTSAPLVVYSGSSAPAVSWSLPSVVSSAAPSFSSVSAPLPSLVPPVFFLVPSAPASSSFVPLVASFPLPHLAPSASFPLSLVPTVPRSSADISTGPSFSSLGGAGANISHPDFVDVPGASGASFACADPLQFRDGDESYHKDDKESPALGKSGLSPAFLEVVSLITGFFPAAKPANISHPDFVDVPGCLFCMRRSLAVSGRR